MLRALQCLLVGGRRHRIVSCLERLSVDQGSKIAQTDATQQGNPSARTRLTASDQLENRQSAQGAQNGVSKTVDAPLFARQTAASPYRLSCRGHLRRPLHHGTLHRPSHRRDDCSPWRQHAASLRSQVLVVLSLSCLQDSKLSARM